VKVHPCLFLFPMFPSTYISCTHHPTSHVPFALHPMFPSPYIPCSLRPTSHVPFTLHPMFSSPYIPSSLHPTYTVLFTLHPMFPSPYIHCSFYLMSNTLSPYVDAFTRRLISIISSKVPFDLCLKFPKNPINLYQN